MSGPEREEGAVSEAGMVAPSAQAPGGEAGQSADESQGADEELPLAPASRPEDFRLAGETPRVMRLSRKTLAVIGMVAGLSIGGAVMYAMRQPVALPSQNLMNTNSHARAAEVTSAPGTYDGTTPKLGKPLPGDLGRPILSAEQNGQVVPGPGMGTPGVSDPSLVAAEQARQRVAQERDTARLSQIFSAGANGGRDSGAAAGTRSAQVAAAGTSTGTSASAQASTGSGSNAGTASQSAKRAFMQVASNRTTVSTERVTAPVSPNVVQAGSIIPAALITGIRSDLPGQITAQVTQNVYDSPTGRILLIPQGSRLIGEYDSEVAAGQTRVLLAWDRLILPGGRSILLDRQPGGDASGFAGVQDKVNYHWGNMLRAALISTALGVGTEMVTDNNDPLVQALRYGTQDTINQVGKQLIQREMNVAPTLTIRPGYPIRVIVTRDLVVEDAAEGGRP